MKKYLVSLYGKDVEIMQDDDGKFIKPELVKYYEQYGTAVKPSFEPIIVARKPFKTSVAENIMQYGVGGINIDECRIGNEHFEIKDDSYDNNDNQSCFGNIKITPKEYDGRFPANVIHDGSEEAIKDMPNTNSTPRTETVKGTGGIGQVTNFQRGSETSNFNDSGSAARYFYCAKASKKDRDEGLDEFEENKVNDGRETPIDNAFQRGETPRKNIHPTVKPTTLMQYLVRLVSPKGATILDCFNGSGSTGKAVMYENRERNANYKYIGIEMTEEYLPISKARIEYICNMKDEEIKEKQLSMFDEAENEDTNN